MANLHLRVRGEGANMSEEQIVPPEETTTPEVDGIETPEVQVETPVQEPVENPEPGTVEYTQAVEKKIGKVKSQQYRAEAERDLLKQRLDEYEKKAATPATPVDPVSTFKEPEPSEGVYDDYNQYIKDLASWQFRKEQAIHQANSVQQEAISNANKIETDFKGMVDSSKILEDHPDFYEKMRFVNLVPGIKEAVLTSEKAPELALHLANNPEIMRDLNSLSPLVAAKKLGAIEAKLLGKVEKKIVSGAPSPISPVATSTGVVAEDNPKDVNEWMKKRNQRELNKITENVQGGKLN